MEEKKYKLGDKYIQKNGCPRCGSDLEVIEGVAVVCTNWQHPNVKGMYYKGGNQSCSYCIVSG